MLIEGNDEKVLKLFFDGGQTAARPGGRAQGWPLAARRHEGLEAPPGRWPGKRRAQ